MKFIYLIIILLTTIGLQAQDKELGFTVGTMYYLGDLNQQHFHKPRPAIGIVYRRGYQKRLALEYHAIAGLVQGADSNSSDPYLNNRNLSFRSSLVEAGVQLEINYFDFVRKSTKNWASPYLFFGLTAFYFNPQAKQNGEWRDLQAIGTEGQGRGLGKRYNLINFAVPMGIGFKCNLGKTLGLTVFTGLRKTFTDHLDDVGGLYADPALFNEADLLLADPSKQQTVRLDGNAGTERGNSNTKDWYSYTGVVISFKTNQNKSKCPKW